MNELRPKYFQPTTPVETILRRIKGNFRRNMILNALEYENIESIPEVWRTHDLDRDNKYFLVVQNPQLCGGEDLPDLLDGEVEIARHSLVDSVHNEVESLRAQLDTDGTSIQLRLVDEIMYWEGQEFQLENDQFPGPLTAEEVLNVFRNSEPCACLSPCEQRFSSDFYPDLDELANKLDIKQVWED